MATDYVTKECAKLLQQKGYPLQKVYRDNGDRPLFYDLPQEHPDWSQCDAWYYPTLWDAHQWLMNIKGVFVNVWWYIRMPDCVGRFSFCVENMLQEQDRHTDGKDYSDYRIALQAGIMDALKLFEL